MTTGQSAVAHESAEDADLLKIREVASMLRVSRSTVVRAYEAGDLPVVRFRRSYRVPRAFVEEVLAAARPGHPVIVEKFGREWSERGIAEVSA